MDPKNPKKKKKTLTLDLIKKIIIIKQLIIKRSKSKPMHKNLTLQLLEKKQ